MRKKIILSFDYELFFGDRSGSIKNTLINPTRMLLDSMDDIGAKGSFFVDYLMLKRMLAECEETKAEAAIIIEQLQEIVSRGHRIELHLHPHWWDAKNIKGRWDFSDYSRYRLCSFSEPDITRMFEEGTNFLEDVARKVVKAYKVIAFRAGGWAVFPFDLLKKGFEKSGIKVDSSIMRGSLIRTPYYELDFRNTPNYDIYRFSDNVMAVDDKGCFKEVPISSLQFNCFTFFMTNVYFKAHKAQLKHLTDGTHYRSSDPPMESRALSLWELAHRHRPYSLDGVVSPFVLNWMIRESKRKLIVFISHPKDIMPISCKNILGMKGKGYEFCTYMDIAKE